MKQLILLAALFTSFCALSKSYELKSPNGSILISISADDQLRWSVQHDGEAVITPSCISLTLSDGKVLGRQSKVSKATRENVDLCFATPFYKKSQVHDNYNQLTLKCKDGYSVQFRAYDDGAAYRFLIDAPCLYEIADEGAEFNFTADHKVFVPYVNDNRGGDRWSYSFESYYDEQPISAMYTDSLAITPLLVDLTNGRKALIMEGGVENYPGMYLVRNTDRPNSIKAQYPPIISDGEWGGYMGMNYISTARAAKIADINGPCQLPWRAIVISNKDAELLDCDMAQCLASPSRVEDISWIKPGLVSWDWWNTTNLTGVDFKAGMNTDTYKYFIDFASANGIPYIIIDAGWSGSRSDWKGETLMECTPDIDLPQVIQHGQQRGVGVILWASWALTDKEKDIAFPHYAKMGIKGFKVDFLDRDDQTMVQSMWDIAKCAADNHLLLDLHGMKPGGLQRTYPNVVNFEGVKGLENTKWAAMDGDVSVDDFLRYDVTIPYVRMACGPMDYTPGAMTNAAKHYFRPINDHPMSQGTRAHQMAMYVIYEAPLQMMADSPSAYMRNQQCTDFIASVPTVFDATVPIDGEVGEYAVLARSKGGDWWLAGLNNWTPRSVAVDLSFLPDGNYAAEMFTDGVNADREGSDYKHQHLTLSNNDTLELEMAPGGGFAIRLKPQDDQ